MDLIAYDDALSSLKVELEKDEKEKIEINWEIRDLYIASLLKRVLTICESRLERMKTYFWI